MKQKTQEISEGLRNCQARILTIQLKRPISPNDPEVYRALGVKKLLITQDK